MAVAPLTITPPSDPASGQAVLVVTSPVAAASSPATYTLTCKAPPPLTLAATSPVSPASQALKLLHRRRADVHLQRHDQRQQAGHGQLPLEAAERRTARRRR